MWHYQAEHRTSSLFTKQIKFNRQNYLNRSVLSCIKNSCLLALLSISSTKSLIFIQFQLPKGKEGKLPNNMRKLSLGSVKYKNVYYNTIFRQKTDMKLTESYRNVFFGFTVQRFLFSFLKNILLLSIIFNVSHERW